MSFKLLKNYIQNKMKMSHIYQPIPRKEGDVDLSSRWCKISHSK